MDGKGSGEPDMPASAERAKMLAREFGQPTPALVRLIQVVRQDAELSALMETKTATGQRRSKRRRERSAGKSKSSMLAPDGRPRGQAPTPESSQKAALLLLLATDYANGLTQVQIAEKHGLHVQTVRKRLVQTGVDTRTHLPVSTDDELRQACKAMKEGASARESPMGSASRTRRSSVRSDMLTGCRNHHHAPRQRATWKLDHLRAPLRKCL